MPIKIPKRTKTLSKNNKIYYKISDEINRAAQIKHYWDHKSTIAPLSILHRMREYGSIPQLKSFKKYPDILNEKTIVDAYRTYMDKCNDAERAILVKNKMMTFIKKIDDLR